jgi:serine/threonine-protein kinase
MSRTFGPFELMKQLAVGGMAEVYLARTGGIGGFEKRLALKMIHPKFSEDSRFIEMFVEEAKIAVQLNHANIGQIFDLGKIGGTYYIAMEFIEGADVHRILKRARERRVEIPIEVVCFVGAAIAAGLDYAHHRQDAHGRPLDIVHRDVSPQNVLVSFAGDVKIVDFGIAKAAVRARETEAGVIKGKFSYMSPEQAKGQPIDHRSDIYSAGIILHEMLCGQQVFTGENVADLLSKVRKAEVTPPTLLRPDTPAALERTLLRTLAKRPRDRHGSALEMHRELSRLLATIAPGFTALRLGTFVRELFEDEAKDAFVAKPLARHEYPVEESQSVIFDTSDPGQVQSVLSAPMEQGRVGPTVAIEAPPVESTILADEGTAPDTDPGETGDEWDARTSFDPEMAGRMMAEAVGTTPAGRGHDIRTESMAPMPPLPTKSTVPSRPPPVPAKSSPPPVPPARPAPPPPAPARKSVPPPPPPRPGAPSIPETRASAPSPSRPPARPAPIVGGVTREVRALRKFALPKLPGWAWAGIGLLAALVLVAVVVALQPPGLGPPVMVIVTTPPDASVIVAGIPRPHPVRVDGLAAGSRVRAEASAPGYVPWLEDIDIQPGLTQYNVVLVPLRGTLFVESDPAGATVLVDGTPVGVTPVRIPELQATGQVAIDLSLTGYFPKRVIHTWDGTRSGHVRERLDPLPPPPRKRR